MVINNCSSCLNYYEMKINEKESATHPYIVKTYDSELSKLTVTT